MSTRANIIVKDSHDTLFFYRHSDGYPEGAVPLLEKFLGFVKEGLIRDNVGQAAGWLIMLGASEYSTMDRNILVPSQDGFSGWKVGAIEPTTEIHGDVEYIYTVNLDTKEITTKTYEEYHNE